jgi:hypothetical protein
MLVLNDYIIQLNTVDEHGRGEGGPAPTPSFLYCTCYYFTKMFSNDIMIRFKKISLLILVMFRFDVQCFLCWVIVDVGSYFKLVHIRHICIRGSVFRGWVVRCWVVQGSAARCLVVRGSVGASNTYLVCLEWWDPDLVQNAPNLQHYCFALSPQRPYVEYKRMVLEHTHGLFIT